MARIAATLISGLAYGLLFPPLAWGWLAWVGLLPLLAAMRGVSGWRAAGLAALWGWAGTLSVIVWLVPTLHQHFEQSLPFSIAFWLGFGATALSPYYAIALGGFAHVAARFEAPARVLLFACAWVAAELARVHLGFQSPWTRLGDSQIDAVALRQVADLGGVYAVSALVAAVNAALFEVGAAALQARRGRPSSWRPALLAAGTAATLVVAAFAYGQWRLASKAAPTRTLRVAVVQGNLDPALRWRRLTASRVIGRYRDLTLQLAREGGDAPDLVVWPENAIQTPLDDRSYGPPVIRLAKRAPLLVGAPASETSEAAPGGRRHFNSAHLIRPDGTIDRYDKRRLLPFSETRPLGGVASFGSRGDLDITEYSPGSRSGVFAVDGEPIGVLICMEALYPALAIEAVREGASVLVNLSNDGWYHGRGGAAQHLSLVAFRAIETRTPVVRATTTGVSAVIGPDGEILGELPEGEAGVLSVEVPIAGSGPTLYARLGDWFALGCLLTLGGAALRELVAGRTTRHFRADRATRGVPRG